MPRAVLCALSKAALVFRYVVICGLGLSGCDRPSDARSAIRSAVGSVEAPARDFELLDLRTGEKTTLQKYEGKFIVLNFWATWCAPCIQEMPALERLAKKISEQNAVVLTINTDGPSEDEAVRKFAQDKGLSLPILRDPEMKVTTLFGLTGFPETLFIDSKGRLLEVVDPDSKKTVRRVLSDRPWDSPAYVKFVSDLIAGAKQ